MRRWRQATGADLPRTEHGMKAGEEYHLERQGTIKLKTYNLKEGTVVDGKQSQRKEICQPIHESNREEAGPQGGK